MREPDSLSPMSRPLARYNARPIHTCTEREMGRGGGGMGGGGGRTK